MSKTPKGSVCQEEDPLQEDHDNQMMALSAQRAEALRKYKPPGKTSEPDPEDGGGRRIGQGRKYS